VSVFGRVETVELLGLIGNTGARQSGFRDVPVPCGFVLGSKNLDHSATIPVSVTLDAEYASLCGSDGDQHSRGR
jgi:hypothetical protein